jgi:hypothetical protein
MRENFAFSMGGWMAQQLKRFSAGAAVDQWDELAEKCSHLSYKMKTE